MFQLDKLTAKPRTADHLSKRRHQRGSAARWLPGHEVLRTSWASSRAIERPTSLLAVPGMQGRQLPRDVPIEAHAGEGKHKRRGNNRVDGKQESEKIPPHEEARVAVNDTAIQLG